jgi:hypothetical protein
MLRSENSLFEKSLLPSTVTPPDLRSVNLKIVDIGTYNSSKIDGNTIIDRTLMKGLRD